MIGFHVIDTTMRLYRRIFNTRQKPINPAWDTALNHWMDNHKFVPLFFGVELSTYSVKINDQKIWVENHPYASFCRVLSSNLSRKESVKTKTLLRAEKKVIRDLTEWFVENKPIEHFTPTEMRSHYQQWLETKFPWND